MLSQHQCPEPDGTAGDHRVVARLEPHLLDRRDPLPVQFLDLGLAHRCRQADARLGPGIVELGHGQPSLAGQLVGGVQPRPAAVGQAEGAPRAGPGLGQPLREGQAEDRA